MFAKNSLRLYAASVPSHEPDHLQAARPVPNSLTLGTASLRVLAHPVRVRVLGLLREHGPSTATLLAGRLGLNSGSTSYHLRQLAAGGLVEEDHERGNARDRWWRSVHRATYFDPYEVPESDRGASAVYMAAIAAEYADRIQLAARDLLELPPAWQRSGDLSDFRLRLTPDETAAIVTELHGVIARYRPADEPGGDAVPDSETVVVQVQVMPQLAPPAAHDDAVPTTTAGAHPAAPRR